MRQSDTGLGTIDTVVNKKETVPFSQEICRMMSKTGKLGEHYSGVS